MSSTSAPSSERAVSQKFDRCLADFLVKAGVGFGIGVVTSVVIFRRRTWPIWLSTGFGMGTSYADCDRSFNPTRLQGARIVPATPTAPSPAKPTEIKHKV